VAPGLGHSIAATDELEALLVIGSNLRHEVPILAHRVRKAALRGAKVSFINPAPFPYLFPVARYEVVGGDGAIRFLAGVLRAALGSAAAPTEVAPLLEGVAVEESHRGIADALQAGTRRAIWLGALSLRSHRYGEVRALARALAAATGATVGELAEGGNAAGAAYAGVLPHRAAAGAARANSGLDARAMLERPLAGYLLVNCEPWADAAQPAALETLGRARALVAVTPFASAEMRRVAHVLLPAGTFAESSGTYVSLEGRWQSQSGVARPLGTARPAWKILRVLGNLLHLAGFDYESSEQVRDELRAALAAANVHEAAIPAGNGQWAGAAAESVIDLGMYQIDPVLRRAPSLKRTADGRAANAVYAP